MEAASLDKERTMPANRQRVQTPLSRLDKRMGRDEKAESAKADPPCPKPVLDQEGDGDTERPSGGY